MHAHSLRERSVLAKPSSQFVLVALCAAFGACGGVGGGASLLTGGANPGGFVDAPFHFEKMGFNGTVHSIAMATDGSGDAYVGGEFTSFTGTNSNRILRLNANGSVDTAFAVGTGFIDAVTTIAPATDGSGDVYVGGFFNSYDGTNSSAIIRLNSDGTVDAGFDVGTGFNNLVLSLATATDGSGDLYVCGFFTNYNGTPSNGLIRLNADGSPDAGFAIGTGIGGMVSTVVPTNDGSGDVYIGGDFTSYDGVAAKRILRLNSDGSIDAGFDVGTGFEFGNIVNAIAPAADGFGAVYVGGSFTSFNGAPANRVLRLLADGSVDASFAIGAGFNGAVNVLRQPMDGTGDVYVGGDFTSYNGTSSTRLIRLNSNGTRDPGFVVGTGFNRAVQSIAPTEDATGQVLIGGEFSSYNGKGAHRITRVQANGLVLAKFDIGTGFDDLVNVLAPATDGSGDMYAGGFFTSYNGAAANRILRLQADGSIDAGFNAGAGFDDLVFTLATAQDNSGDIYVGGFFTTFDGSTANRIARLNSDGTLDAGFAVGTGFDGFVYTIAPTKDGSGDVYVGGNFTEYNGVPANNILRLNSDGSVDPKFELGTGFDSFVQTIAVANDGSRDLFVGGFFSSFNGTPASYFIRLHANASMDTSFVVGTGFNDVVMAVAPATDGSGDVFVGGFFNEYDGTAAGRVVRLNTDGLMDAGFSTGLGFDGFVFALATAFDGSGDVFVGGDFTDYDGVGFSNVARIAADGAARVGFATGTGFDGYVATLAPAVDGSGEVYVGGLFSNYDGTQVDHCTALNADGSVD